MRQIFLDTETTGLYPDHGHRVIEIAAVEMISRRPTNNHFHVYLNPEREIDAGAQEVHGITSEFLQDKPLFDRVAQDFADFIKNAEIIIHNAPFDVGFLNMELGRVGMPPMHELCGKITDTLKMAKDARPGQRNNLNALCSHFGIDNSKRTLHGALLDAELLAEVYMAMTRGQDSLMMDLAHQDVVTNHAFQRENQAPLKILAADGDELKAHEAYLEGIAKSGALPW
jgi:DNA polymerase-3 subunit epsilon